MIIIDPWLNPTAEGLADQWIGVYPGTDTALFLGVAYHMIKNNLQDADEIRVLAGKSQPPSPRRSSPDKVPASSPPVSRWPRLTTPSDG